jgi:hypothetical protein
MQSRIENIEAKKLVGKRLMMSLIDNKTGVTWKSFMQRRRETTNSVHGFQIPIIYLMTDPILKYWVRNISMQIQILKKIFESQFETIPFELLF